jgi:hypothetical protein
MSSQQDIEKLLFTFNEEIFKINSREFDTNMHCPLFNFHSSYHYHK